MVHLWDLPKSKFSPVVFKEHSESERDCFVFLGLTIFLSEKKSQKWKSYIHDNNHHELSKLIKLIKLLCWVGSSVIGFSHMLNIALYSKMFKIVRCHERQIHTRSKINMKIHVGGVGRWKLFHATAANAEHTWYAYSTNCGVYHECARDSQLLMAR